MINNERLAGVTAEDTPNAGLGYSIEEGGVRYRGWQRGRRNAEGVYETAVYRDVLIIDDLDDEQRALQLAKRATTLFGIDTDIENEVLLSVLMKPVERAAASPVDLVNKLRKRGMTPAEIFEMVKKELGM
jgi:hypothetical protein